MQASQFAFSGGVPVTYEFSIVSSSAVITNLTKSTDGTINISAVFTLGPYQLKPLALVWADIWRRLPARRRMIGFMETYCLSKSPNSRRMPVNVPSLTIRSSGARRTACVEFNVRSCRAR